MHTDQNTTSKDGAAGPSDLDLDLGLPLSLQELYWGRLAGKACRTPLLELDVVGSYQLHSRDSVIRRASHRPEFSPSRCDACPASITLAGQANCRRPAMREIHVAYTAHEAGWAVLLRTDLSEVLNIDVEIPCLERAGKVKK